jgi:hypothetical protein
MIVDTLPGTELLTVAQATRLPWMPRPGDRTLHPGALHRWMQVGAHCSDGTIIRLRSVRLGGRVYTTAAWLREFIERQNTDPEATQPAPATLRERRARASAADRKLAAAGLS